MNYTRRPLVSPKGCLFQIKKCLPVLHCNYVMAYHKIDSIHKMIMTTFHKNKYNNSNRIPLSDSDSFNALWLNQALHSLPTSWFVM